MNLIFLYGPDGCGKTYAQKVLQERIRNIKFVSFEPDCLGKVNGVVDTGDNGDLSAETQPISLPKSFLLSIRYLVRFVLLRLRYRGGITIVVSRGPLEFGVNNTHKRLPRFYGVFMARLIGGRSFLICRNIDLILSKKRELSRSRILELYEDYMVACDKFINNNSNEELLASLDPEFEL